MDSNETEPDYENRTVAVVYRDGAKSIKVEGICIRWRPGKALLLKTKKAQYGQLIEAGLIDSITVLDQTVKLLQTSIKPVTVRDVRRHMLNYHGELLSAVNVWSDEEALGIHEELHAQHGDDLGHNHDGK